MSLEEILSESQISEYNVPIEEEELALEADTEETRSESPHRLEPRSSESSLKPRKFAFKLKNVENGNILTVHHTVKEGERLLRIRIAVCCFNEQSTQLVVIDKRGNVFVFDFVKKRYWRLNLLLPKASTIRSSQSYNSDFIVGNKLGQMYVIDVENSLVVNALHVATDSIEEISFGPPKAKEPLALLRFGHEAQLLKLNNFFPTHRLEFDQVRFALKFASYLPYSDQIFTCFTNDSVHIWSTLTFNTLRIVHPIKARDRKLRLLPANEQVPEFSLHDSSDSDANQLDEFPFNCQDQDYSNGYLLGYCFTPDGNKFCLTTLDGYLLVLSAQTFDLEKLFRLRDFLLKHVTFLPHPKERILFGLTSKGQVVMLDLANNDFKLILQSCNASGINLSRDGKLIVVQSKGGEANVWSTCRLYNTLVSQVQCLAMMRTATKQKKPLPNCSINECLHEDLRKLLKRDRLTTMIMEFGSYPTKYRHLIWTTLLQLPCNSRQFQQLLKLGVPIAVKQRAQNLRVKNDTLKRGMIKIWSCLSHWCKVFAYAEFMPYLIFPFVKMFPKNSLVCFELLATLLLNHFQLWFEFYPVEPSNYLAMCENLLHKNDERLCKYFATLEITSKDYAWSLLTNAFSEVLDEEQWLTLWDHIITEPPYFLVFVTVAYNMIQREVLLRLPDKSAVSLFYHEQNPVDINLLLSKARKISQKCQPALHPERYMLNFVAIPKNVYPKFLNYPNKWIDQQEEKTVALEQQHRQIDARIRELEFEEMKVVQSLEEGLKREEHERRVKEMETRYQEALRQEEERVACQRKMLLLYQKEIRARKCEVVDKLKESEHRRKAIEMEKDIEVLMNNIEHERRRNNQELLLAEDEIRNQEVELLCQKYTVKHQLVDQPLAQKFYENVKKLCLERRLLDNTLRQLNIEHMMPLTTSSDTCLSAELSQIEQSITKIQEEFTEIISDEKNENEKTSENVPSSSHRSLSNIHSKTTYTS